jgi:hypothetical protein
LPELRSPQTLHGISNNRSPKKPSSANFESKIVLTQSTDKTQHNFLPVRRGFSGKDLTLVIIEFPPLLEPTPTDLIITNSSIMLLFSRCL